MRLVARNRLALTRIRTKREYAPLSRTRRKRAASRGAAKAGRGRDYATADDCARGIPTCQPRPPAADIYFVEIHRHGPNNPTASVRTSKWTTSIIPPGMIQRIQTCARGLQLPSPMGRGTFVLRIQGISGQTRFLSTGTDVVSIIRSKQIER